MNISAQQHIEAHALPMPTAQIRLALAHAPRRGHEQGKAHISSRFREHIRRIRADHARSGHCR
jgi:hypothetical protein